jgi:excisionase family DNA binding protein
MSKYYNLEEAARALAISEDELKAMVSNHQIRAMRDGATMQFRAADVEEMARRRGLGSDPEMSLSDPDLSLSKVDLSTPAGSSSGSGEVDLSEFQLGTAHPDLGHPTIDLPRFSDDAERDVLLDDLSVPASNSSSTILGMKSGGKLPSDSDVRLVPDNVKGVSDSDVRLSPTHKAPSDSDVTLVSDDQSSEFPKSGGDTSVRPSPLLGSSAEVAAGSSADADSDFELTPSSVIGALQPESGSDFELSAIDASDEFDSTPLGDPGDSDVTAGHPGASGINLGRPSDSGINLGGIEGLNLASASSADIQLAPIDDGGSAAPASKPKPKSSPPLAKPKQSLSATPPPTVRKGDKDIFEDTDFEVDAFDSDENEDRTMQLEANSDFDLDESDSASEVFAIDEDEVDENAATAMGPASLDDEEDSGEFGGEEAGIASSGWDVDSEPAPVVAGSASQGTVMASRGGDSAEWGGLWVGFLGVSTILTLLLAFVSIDLVRNLYDFRSGGMTSGIINALGGLFK